MHGKSGKNNTADFQQIGEQNFINQYSITCDNSWQDIDLVLSCFNNIHNRLMKDLSFESKIKYHLAWLATFRYFNDFDQNNMHNNRSMEKNFGWDVRNIIEFLNSAREKKMKFVRFHFF